MTKISPEFLGLQAALAGEYSLERELGRGGMGIVYLARDVQLDRQVAIKVLPGELAARPEARERFLREARTAAGLSHPHIVPIHRVGEAGGFVFFVMSYVAGETLGERLRTRGPLPPPEAMRIMREVAWALAHAHGRGVVHRDVKPDNILLEQGTGRAVVTDFGIAYRGDVATSTDPGRIMGTAHFMSPEQANSEPVDGRSDLYSLGVVGYLASSGRLPFEATTVPALLVKQASERAPAVVAVAPGLPAALARAIDRCLEHDPARRFADGAALADALAPVADPRQSLAAPLRHWLAARNPAQWAYTAWTGVMSLAFVAELIVGAQPHRRSMLMGLPMDLLLIAAPLVPIVVYHISQARRLFWAGYTLRDLRDALGIAAEERREREALERREPLTAAEHILRGLTYVACGSALAISTTTDLLFASRVRIPMHYFAVIIYGSWIVALLLLVAMNMAEVPLLPPPVRRFFRVGVRERLWNSKLGAWIARLVKAPTQSGAVDAGVFRATESALGLAASELFAALPREYREQLADLPRTVEELERRAAEARASVETLASLAHAAGANDELVEARRKNASEQLASSVAALEAIRLDLLRLHAGANELAPLTTLLDAARLLGDDVTRLAEARNEVAHAPLQGRLGAGRIATPA